MICYAVKINNKYFKEYVYADKTINGRYAGHTQFGSTVQEGDIIGLILSDVPERTETKRSIGGSISTIYQIEGMQNKVIKIVPVQS